MENDVRRYLSKFTSMSNIKTETLPKCEMDIAGVQELIDNGEYLEKEGELSEYEQGIAYFFGIGQIRDDERGMQLLRMAAQEGDADAMNLYGFACYHTSLGCKDMPEKKEWYERQAVKWYTEAAQMGQLEAIFNLAVCLLEGKGLQADEERGLRYLTTASKGGYERAQRYLAQYNEAHGIKEAVERELPYEQVMEILVTEMKKGIASMGTDAKRANMVGVFNEIAEEKGYAWVKNPTLGWICSKTEGKTYLITEAELNELASLL